jgi:hypothetical protein
MDGHQLTKDFLALFPQDAPGDHNAQLQPSGHGASPHEHDIQQQMSLGFPGQASGSNNQQLNFDMLLLGAAGMPSMQDTSSPSNPQAINQGQGALDHQV